MKKTSSPNDESSHLLSEKTPHYGPQPNEKKQQPNSSNNPFDELPAESLAHIIKFLKWKNVLLFRQVDKRTNAITLETSLEDINDLRERSEQAKKIHLDEEENEYAEKDNVSMDEAIGTDLITRKEKKKNVGDFLALLRAHQATAQEIIVKRKAAATSEWLLDTFQSRHPQDEGHILCWLLLPALVCGGLGYAFYGTIPMTGCFTLLGVMGGGVGLGTSHHCLLSNRDHAREARILEKNMMDDIRDQLPPKLIKMGK